MLSDLHFGMHCLHHHVFSYRLSSFRDNIDLVLKTITARGFISPGAQEGYGTFCGLQRFFVHFSPYYLDLFPGFAHSKFQVFNNIEIGSELVSFYDDLVPYQMLNALQGKFADHLLAQLIILLS